MITPVQIFFFLVALIPLVIIARWYDNQKHHTIIEKSSLVASMIGALGVVLSVWLSAGAMIVGVVLFTTASHQRTS